MAYGTIKVDTITFTDGGVDKSVSVSGLVENPTFTGNVTATGTISGDILRGQTISGVTVTGTTANFTSGNFTNISGGTHTITSGVFASGTAANPSISFVSDPNTGIYSPGADQVAISTNGTGRLFVDANGNVQIGSNTSTGARVDITASSDIFSFGSASRRLYAWADSGGVSLLNADSQTGDGFYIDEAGSNIRFWTGSTERMRLDSSGRLGLGTSSPQTLLHLNSAAGTNTTLAYAEDNALKWYNRYNASDGSFQIVDVVNTTTRLHVSNTGNVGIGTTSPGQALHVVGKGRFQESASSGAIAFIGANATEAYIDTGTYSSNQPLAFKIEGTERARIDGSGRLLVGTSSSVGNATFSTAEFVKNTLPEVVIGRSDAPALSGDGIGRIHFNGNAGGVWETHASITCQVDGASGSGDKPGRLVFSTTADGASSPTERMRIQANGRIGFGCTPDGTVSTTGVQTGGAEGWIIAKRADQPCIFVNRDNTDGPIVDIYRSGTLVGTISVTTTATAYNTSSDYRLKENVVPLTGAADRVNQLQVHRFNFIADPDKTVDGFLAHEAQAVVPECVTGEKDAVDENGNPVYQGIDQSKLVPLLTAALQEALAEIENLKARVTALEP